MAVIYSYFQPRRTRLEAFKYYGRKFMWSLIAMVAVGDIIIMWKFFYVIVLGIK